MSCTAPSCRCVSPCRAWCADGPAEDAADEEYIAALERHAEERRREAEDHCEEAA